MNLIVDIGNTHTKIGWFDRGKMVSRDIQAAGDLDENDIMGRFPVEMAIVSIAGKAELKAFRSMGSLKKILFLDHKTPLPIKIKYDTPESLGHDRIAAAVGAWAIFPENNILVMDLGTAITIDLITSEGEYKGGNISPGLLTRFHSLHEYTANLPLVSKDISFPTFGTNTIQAIAAGVQRGICFELNGYISEYENLYPGCKIIITGGDAGLFVPTLKNAIFAFPELVLTGLNHILEFNALE